MVRIASDINKDLDSYISERRGGGGWNPFKHKAKSKSAQDLIHEAAAEDEDLSPDERKRLEKMQSRIQAIDEEEHAHPEEAPELEEQRESLLTRFFNFFRGAEREHRAEEAEQIMQIEERLDEDVARVLRIVHTQLEKLPSEEKSRFRRSQEFEQYRALLEKYGLAKKREAPQPIAPAAAPKIDEPRSGHRFDPQPVRMERPSAAPQLRPVPKAEPHQHESKPASQEQRSAAQAAILMAAGVAAASGPKKSAPVHDDPDYPDLRSLQK